MPISLEQHTYCTCHNYSEILNPFTNNMDIQLNSNESSSINPFNINEVEESKSALLIKPSILTEKNLVIIEPSMNNINDGSVKIRVNANNSIIHMNEESTTRAKAEPSKLKLRTQVLSQGTKAIITEIIFWNQSIKL